jgi:type IV pilus assembly protein PilB
MRLLEASSPLAGLNEMGFDGEVIVQLKRILIQPQGMLLVTGPTGSGKSTTLYSSLNFLRGPGVNIVTVEDPIEYMIDGINQVQVHPKAGLTFSTALRSILRQDPNIIMIGEIRDSETAEIALKASQTGHFVLSTLHTNDAVSAIVRLLDLGIPGYLIASSMTGIVAQRLVRKLCKCKSASVASPELLARLAAHGVDDSSLTTYAPVGCRECDHTGYRGRVGVYEVLTLDEPMRRAIRSGAPTDQIRQLASIAGTRWIQEDGLDKIRSGITTFDEIMRVVAFDDSKPELCQRCNRELAPAFLYCPYCSARRVAVAPAGPVTSAAHVPPGVAPAVAELVTAGSSSGHDLHLSHRPTHQSSDPSNNPHSVQGTAYLRRNLRQSDRGSDTRTAEQDHAARRTDTPVLDEESVGDTSTKLSKLVREYKKERR